MGPHRSRPTEFTEAKCPFVKTTTDAIKTIATETVTAGLDWTSLSLGSRNKFAPMKKHLHADGRMA